MRQKRHAITLMVVVFVFSALFLTILGRFLYIQATGEVYNVDLEEYAENMRETETTLPAERGLIYDRSGMVLADNQPVYNMYAILDEVYTGESETPLHVVDVERTARQLATVIDMSEEDLRSHLQDAVDNDRFQIAFGSAGRGLSEDTYQEIQELDLSGIYFNETKDRYYPNGLYASHVIGYTAFDGEDGSKQVTGMYGVERQLNDQLSGQDGYVNYQQDAFGDPLRNQEEVVQAPDDGDHVHLTIDQKIQSFLEDAMTTVENEYDPERIMAGVMDPDTGEVLAMSNRPTFNPNSRENIENWYNDMISTPFEPGSTMKIFTVAAAMEAGVYNGQSTYESGEFKISEHGRSINDHDVDGWGTISFNEGVLRSSNVAMAELVWNYLEPDRFLEYLKAFHFDRKTGIDLNGERIGEISYGGPWEQITTGYGQGSTFTPMQIMKAATTLANGGEMVKPYVVSHLTDSETGETYQKSEREVVGQPISADTVDELKDLLGRVVTDEEGTANSFQLDGFTSLGKTGTASIPDPETGLYMRGGGNYVFSYIGLAPKDDPELMMYVAVKQPDVEYRYQGSETTTYIYNTVMENSLHYLDVSPDRNDTNSTSTQSLPDVTGQQVNEAVSQLEEQGMSVQVVGAGDTINAMWPASGSDVVSGQRVLLQTNGELTMPDLTGWTLRDVLALARLNDLDLDYMGTGLVQQQSIKPNATFDKGQTLVVELTQSDDDETEEDVEDTE
ncbi:penicillin-binding protein 2B [Alkalibacillus flavidus]|uniref:serine-type D-Ala-D-Ala carboxypeptidase n=1 Tax=Alkalibacillus flavidus TaxID=546021 RepID=A0ABV2KU18_9BACI